MRNKLKNLFFTGCFFLPAIGSWAQDLDAVRKQFPDEKAVLLNKVLEYTITLKNDQPDVQSRELQEIAFLSSAASAYVGSYSFPHSDFQQLVSYEAHTTTADKKTLKVSDFKTSSSKASFVFYDDMKETSFNFPSIEPGAVGSLDVSWTNKDPHLLSPFYFESYMAVANSELKVSVSDDIKMRFYKAGLDTGRIEVRVEKKRRMNVYTFRYVNCPAGRRFENAPGFAWYAPHVVLCIDSFKDSSGKTVPYLSGPGDLYRLNYSFIKSVNTQVSPELKRVTDSITSKITTQDGKARAIYSWVQNHIKYIAFEEGMEGFVPREAGLVCTRRFGDCKDMASILTEMMRAAGLTAYFTWIGTRDLPYAFTKTPLPLVSNHMICTILLNGKYIFLDGTDPTCIFGMPSSGIQDKEAMIAVTEKEYKILNVPTVEPEKNVLVDTTWIEIAPEGLRGRIKQDLKGYFGSEMNSKLMYWNQKNILDHMGGIFGRGSNKFQLDTYSIDKKTADGEVGISGTFRLPDYAKKLGNEYYLNLNLFKFFADDHVDFPKRKVPLSREFKYTRKYVTVLKLPEGYKLTYLPKSKEARSNSWGFKMTYEQKDNLVILTQEFVNDSLMLTSDQFENWNTGLEALFPAYKETLSFAKI